MPETDRPPERIWLDDEELEAHFDRLREKYSKDGGDGEWEDVPGSWQQNELTKDLRRR